MNIQAMAKVLCRIMTGWRIDAYTSTAAQKIEMKMQTWTVSDRTSSNPAKRKCAYRVAKCALHY